MGEFWEGVKLGFRTLFSTPISYLTNPVGSTTDLYKKDLVALGYTEIEIAAKVEDYHKSGGIVTDIGEAYGSVTTGIGDAIRKAGGMIAFLGKNLPVILIAAAVIVGAFYVLRLRKVLS